VNISYALSLVPNLITLARLLAVPVAVYVILEGYFVAAFWIFVTAAASDALDGYLAKRLDAVSEIGAYLDPLADKALLVGAYVALAQLALVGVVLSELGLDLRLTFISGALVYIVAVTTFVSGAAYVYKWGAMAVLLERDQ